MSVKINNSLKYLLLSPVLLLSCISQKEIVYLQDATVNELTKIQNYQEITIQPQDILSIIVSSRTPELTFPFNLSTASYQVGGEIPPSMGQQRLLGYSVNKDGNIDFPTFGKIHVEGLTKEELSRLIKNRLMEEDYINDPIVTVQFINFNIYIVGEVNKPGIYEINKSHITLLEALAMAGDLTIYGKRNNVKVIREKNGERIIYNLDLRTKELFNSPAYYLQQNDYIYVEPSKYKARRPN